MLPSWYAGTHRVRGDVHERVAQSGVHHRGQLVKQGHEVHVWVCTESCLARVNDTHWLQGLVGLLKLGAKYWQLLPCTVWPRIQGEFVAGLAKKPIVVGA